MRRPSGLPASIEPIVARLAGLGANLTVELPDGQAIRIGADPGRARAGIRDRLALEALSRGDHLALAEAFVREKIDVSGDWDEVFKVSELLSMDSTRLAKLVFWLRLRFDLRRYDREAVSFHYDQPCDFFLPWLDRWRSYSHGLYESPQDDPSEAQARKMQRAIELCGLQPGMEVLDMGAGWGCFVEYAGLRGIRVHGITISREQHRFVSQLIRDRELPCTIELVDFVDYTPRTRFQAAVFMGTLEHVPDYRRVAGFLRGNLAPEGRVWADFCARREGFLPGTFMRRYLWPGPVTYVNVHALVHELVRSGFNVHELRDDTLSYACTVRDWARRLEAARADLAAKWGEERVRVFLLFLRGSHYFLTHRHTQAYHLVAGLEPAPLRTGA